VNGVWSSSLIRDEATYEWGPGKLWWRKHPDLQVREIGGTRFCGDTKNSVVIEEEEAAGC